MVRKFYIDVVVKTTAVILTFIVLISMLMFLYYLAPALHLAQVRGWVDVYIIGMILVVFITIIILGCIAIVAGADL